MPLRRPIADVYNQATALRDHDIGGMGGSEEGGTDTSIHHAVPPMRRLLPKGRRPREFTIFHHALVTTPCGIDQYGEPFTSIFDSPKGGCGIRVARVIALDSLNRGRQVSRVNASARGEPQAGSFRENSARR